MLVPKVLPDGETGTGFKVFAGQVETLHFCLDGVERVSWRVSVADQYDVIMHVTMTCAGERYEVTERERCSEFDGCVDLLKEHAPFFSKLGASVASTPTSDRAGPLATLSLSFDNSYSMFTAKTLEVVMHKVGGVSRDVCSFSAAMQSRNDWEEVLRIFHRMLDLGLQPDQECYEAVVQANGAGKRWGIALNLLAEMRSAQMLPSAASYTAAIAACEHHGQAEHALRLMDEMETDVDSVPDSSEDFEWVRWAVSEAVKRCPLGADEARHHLREAELSLARYATSFTTATADDGASFVPPPDDLPAQLNETP